MLSLNIFKTVRLMKLYHAVNDESVIKVTI